MIIWPLDNLATLSKASKATVHYTEWGKVTNDGFSSAATKLTYLCSYYS